VWYVKNNAAAGGLGRSNDPFDTLLEAQTASLANDWIFVYFGSGNTTGQDAGILLKNGQHLIGEHAGLAIPIASGSFNGVAAPTTVNLVAAAPGNRPLLDDTVGPAAGTPDDVSRSWWTARATTDVSPGFTRDAILAEAPPDPTEPGGLFDRVGRLVDQLSRSISVA